MTDSKTITNEWLVLLLLILIGFTTYGHLFSTPVLLPMIGQDLSLDTEQLGFIWGMTTFGGLFLALPAGLISDGIGPKLGIVIISIVVVLGLGLLGLAKGLISLSIMMFFAGGVIGALPSVATKAIMMWFPPNRIGLASGIWWCFNRIGMGTGAGVSATLVSPALNGWGNTFLLYGGVLLGIIILWLVIIREPKTAGRATRSPFGESIRNALQTRDVWFCSIALFGTIGSFVGFTGYLPLYLKNIGWTSVQYSLSLTAFMVVMIPSSIIVPGLSDRYSSRKPFYLISALIYIVALMLLVVFKKTPVIWLLIIIAGLNFGTLLPVINAIIAEIEGIGAQYAGTAISFGSGLGGLGGLIFAWASGKLAMLNAALPFIFDAGLCFLCIIPVFFVEQKRSRI